MLKITPTQFVKCLVAGTTNLRNHVAIINNLNVFPVPDGDTGFNMSATVESALQEVLGRPAKDVGVVAKRFAHGSLFGARGNSGVILSQIFKGFAVSLRGVQNATAPQLASAFQAAKKYAYKAVVKPVEGTMLTVVKEVSQKVNTEVKPSMTIKNFFKTVVKTAQTAVANTPNLLPVLKQAGVVDSGAYGFKAFLDGVYKHLCGETLKDQPISADKGAFLMTNEVFKGSFGFCTEFILDTGESKKPFDQNHFLRHLRRHSPTSEIVVYDPPILKVHCHVPNAIKVLNYAQKHGTFSKIKAENIALQVRKQAGITKTTQHKIGVIACHLGEGFCQDAKDYGANFVIEGGQTMNPATKDFVSAIKALQARKIIILPNNKNVVLTVQAAAKVCSNKTVCVLPTHTQTEGLTALIHYNYEADLAENRTAMSEAFENSWTVLVTQATRSATINGLSVTKKDYVALVSDKIVATSKNRITLTQQVTSDLITNNEEVEVVTIYVGKNHKLADGEKIARTLRKHKHVEVSVRYGGQPHHDFVVGLE